MSGENQIKNLVEASIENLRDVLGVNTIIGEMIETKGGVSIIPISRITCGYVAGGGEYNKKSEAADFPFAGGSGAGVSVSPVGFLVVSGTDVRLISIEDSGMVDKAIESIPVISANVEKIIEKAKAKKAAKDEASKDIEIL